jgi:hypothetical protein
MVAFAVAKTCTFVRGNKAVMSHKKTTRAAYVFGIADGLVDCMIYMSIALRWGNLTIHPLVMAELR